MTDACSPKSVINSESFLNSLFRYDNIFPDSHKFFYNCLIDSITEISPVRRIPGRDDIIFILKINDNICSYEYLLGILNSKLMGWYFWKKFQINSEDTFPQIMIRDILQFPIVLSDNSDAKNLKTFVDQMLNLHKLLANSKHPQEKTVIQRQIEATDRQIDQLVYKLYDLTDDEIKIAASGNHHKL